MSKNTNGTGDNGNAEDEKIVRFPTLADRDRMRKEQLAEEAKQQKFKKMQRRGDSGPMFNLNKITPFARFMMIAFLAVHLPLFLMLNHPARLDAFYTLGFVPGYFTGAFDSLPWHAPLGIISHIFVHGSWMHLIFNAVMALAFGVMFERLFGTRTTAIFFFACGIFGAATYMAFEPFATSPVIGASGSISGFFAAAIMIMHEQGRMNRLSARFGRHGYLPTLGFWLLFMIIMGFISGESLAWQAHVGGYVAGAVLYYLLRTGRLKF